MFNLVAALFELDIVLWNSNIGVLPSSGALYQVEWEIWLYNIVDEILGSRGSLVTSNIMLCNWNVWSGSTSSNKYEMTDIY